MQILANIESCEAPRVKCKAKQPLRRKAQTHLSRFASANPKLGPLYSKHRPGTVYTQPTNNSLKNRRIHILMRICACGNCTNMVAPNLHSLSPKAQQRRRNAICCCVFGLVQYEYQREWRLKTCIWQIMSNFGRNQVKLSDGEQVLVSISTVPVVVKERAISPKLYIILDE